MAGSRSRKIRTYASITSPTAPPIFMPRRSTRPDICSRTNGRSRSRCYSGVDTMATSMPWRQWLEAVPSETADFRLRLCPPEFLHRKFCLLGRPKFGADRPGDLRHREDGLGGHVAIVRNDRCDHVDRAGTFLQDFLRLTVRLHAAKDIVSARRRRVIVEVLGPCTLCR